jgi:hypothetical protein
MMRSSATFVGRCLNLRRDSTAKSWALACGDAGVDGNRLHEHVDVLRRPQVAMVHDGDPPTYLNGRPTASRSARDAGSARSMGGADGTMAWANRRRRASAETVVVLILSRRGSNVWESSGRSPGASPLSSRTFATPGGDGRFAQRTSESS